MKLVVIEGPGKRATIKKYLGDGYEVFATKGHVRDLPIHGLGVDIKNNFAPKYEILPDKQDVIKSLEGVASKADQILLATDPDREGEAISWHVANVLKLNPQDNIRIEFNEISKNAVQKAIKEPRAIDLRLVDAQQTRRILDRIVGYKLSPILCRKIQPKLSAGRVQSVTLKLVVEREREIIHFKPEEWWSINALLSKLDENSKSFKATLLNKGDKKIKITSAQGKDDFLADINGQQWRIAGIKKSVTKSHPPAPYITSSMQQDALNKMGMTLKRTTMAAQNLYEGVELVDRGKTALITYIRTDSVRVSPEAQQMAKNYILSKYGEKYYPATPNIYKSKKSAQDAHEAIRPIYIDITPESVRSSLPDDQYKLYKLIYERFLASQMSDATYNSVSVDIAVKDYTFRATGRTPIFDGFTALYQEYVPKDKEKDDETTQAHIPELTEGEIVDLLDLKTEQKFTKPPARYTEASLVKAMEEKGIGRPATYTPTITVLFNRKYVENEGKYIRPTELGCSVTDLLVQHFPDIMDVGFTAEMESDLDEIADGNKDWHKVLALFYEDFSKEMAEAGEAIKSHIEETDEICDKCGSKMIIRTGRYGRFMCCSNYPKCKNIKNIEGEEDSSAIETNEVCPNCGSKLVTRTGKYGKFLSCSNYPTCTYTKNIGENSEKKETDIVCEKCGHKMIERTSKFGKFLACSNYPECKNTLNIGQNGEVEAKPESKISDSDTCPQCGGILVVKTGKFGKFVACSNYPNCNYIKNNKQKSAPVPTDVICDKCGGKMVERVGKFGKFLACGNYPNCKNIKPLVQQNGGPDETNKNKMEN